MKKVVVSLVDLELVLEHLECSHWISAREGLKIIIKKAKKERS